MDQLVQVGHARGPVSPRQLSRHRGRQPRPRCAPAATSDRPRLVAKSAQERQLVRAASDRCRAAAATRRRGPRRHSRCAGPARARDSRATASRRNHAACNAAIVSAQSHWPSASSSKRQRHLPWAVCSQRMFLTHEVNAIAQHVETHAQVHGALDHEVRRIEDHAYGRRVDVAQQLEGQRRARDDRAEMNLEQRLDPAAFESGRDARARRASGRGWRNTRRRGRTWR